MKYETKNAKMLHKMRQFSCKRIKDYHQKFIDTSTGKFFEDYTVYRVCPVYIGDNCQILFDKSGGTYVKFDKCSMIFTNPVFSESALENYYNNLLGYKMHVILKHIS